MEFFFKCVTFDNQIVKSKDIFDKKWDIDSPKSIEATMLLNMLEFIARSAPSQLKGEIIIMNDNKEINET